jgi:hypothetical protein
MYKIESSCSSVTCNNKQAPAASNSLKRNHEKTILDNTSSSEITSVVGGSEKRPRLEQITTSNTTSKYSSTSQHPNSNSDSNVNFNSNNIIEIRDLDTITSEVYEELAELLLNSFHKYGMMTSQEELQFLLNIRESIL